MRPQVSKTTAAWREYVEHMSSIVVDGFSAAITASAAYLLTQMDPEQVGAPGAGRRGGREAGMGSSAARPAGAGASPAP